jgi:DNA-binding Xre family transcriptional regulator
MSKRISYLKLKKLLLDRKMTGQDLRKASGISTATLAKINRDDNLTTAVLLKICNGLGCELEDIMELVDDELTEENG